ncbi:hypothetical protein [Pseudomonas glycinae]|uniref:Uncharacterized protein n=1 Tax=Pseudomonas glycinae TaxID=1785145 RepID=A0ABN5FQA7_9PSED|nr:hypothetical protein [Pseudomonas glycinae]AUG97413.1 hypothetical protein AWU82_28430 [Pseudomonas glycinae]
MQSLLVQPIHDAYVAIVETAHASGLPRTVSNCNANVSADVDVSGNADYIGTANPDLMAIVVTHSLVRTSSSSEDIMADMNQQQDV